GFFSVPVLASPAGNNLRISRQASAYVPPSPGAPYGHLLFLRESTLMAQPMDPKRYDLAGDAFPVAEHVGSVLAMGYFAVSSNGILAYRTGGFSDLMNFAQLSWFDRTGKPLDTLVRSAYTGSVQLSPDGRRAAIEQTDSSNNRDLFIVDIARRIASRFTFDLANDRQPLWSPDGSQLVFDSDRSKPGMSALYRKLANGTGTEELLLDTGLSLIPSSWSRDRRILLFEQHTPNTRFVLWVLQMEGGKPAGKPFPYLQGPFNERQGQFSPDGNWVAYISDDSAEVLFKSASNRFPP